MDQKHLKIFMTTALRWDYNFLQSYLAYLGFFGAIFQIVFFFSLEYIFHFKEAMILRIVASLLSFFLCVIPKDGQINSIKKVYIELVFFVNFPFVFYYTTYINDYNLYWTCSMAFCGFLYGLLAYQLVGIIIYTLITMCILVVGYDLLHPFTHIYTQELVYTHIVSCFSFLISALIRTILQSGYEERVLLKVMNYKSELSLKNYENIKRREEVIEKFIAPLILEEIDSGKSPLDFKPTMIKCCVLFTDMRNYTTFSESHKPKETHDILNNYFEKVSESVIKNGGRVDKLIGDATMAIFDEPKDCLSACFDIRKKMSHENTIRVESGLEPIKFGLGIDYGEVLFANFGSQLKYDRTIVGDVVNVSSRLESLTKSYKVDVLVSEKFIKMLKNFDQYRVVDSVQVKGKTKYIKIYEIFSHNKDIVIQWKMGTKSDLEKVVDLCLKNKKDDAVKILDALIEACPSHTYLMGAKMDLTLEILKQNIVNK